MSRTYWKSVWLRSIALVAMSCSSNSLSSSFWSLSAARSSVTVGTGRIRPARTCFKGTGYGLRMKDSSSSVASVFSRSTVSRPLNSRSCARRLLASILSASSSSLRAFASPLMSRIRCSLARFLSRASSRASSRRSSSASCSAQIWKIDSLALASHASLRALIFSSRFWFSFSVLAFRCARAAACFSRKRNRSSTCSLSCSSNSLFICSSSRFFRSSSSLRFLAMSSSRALMAACRLSAFNSSRLISLSGMAARLRRSPATKPPTNKQ
mmetsp:Transcript_82470/g.238195  ORF Transcript_82470/g.238195 Transcript_82470/m.238195 type:complete len:268 (+) Transcript_82470:253-1056(+)